jgi:hypothetical protein
MNTKLSMLALAALAGMSMAAVTTVMYFDGGKYQKGEVPPFGSWYTYADSTNKAGASIETGTAAMEIMTKVNKLKDTYAGAGFIWAKGGTAVDLSAYEGMGVCLTYTADADFRMEFKQSTIKDANYNGVLVEAQSDMETVYFPFADFAQEDWGDETVVKALDLTKQTGVNFSYKTALAGPNVNMINIAAISFGSSCVNHAPSLKTGVTSPATEKLNEGDTLKVAFKDIFEDADGDALNIVMAVDGYVEDLKDAKSYTLKDVAWIMSKANPTGDNTSATLTFTATDTQGLSVKHTINVTLTDRENAPVAVADAYDAFEDSVLTVGIAHSPIVNDYDADDEPNKKNFKILGYTAPEHGTVALTALTGAFTYTPNPDFYGTDTFTYTIADATGLESVGTVTITVKNVDDPATVVIKDSTYYINDVTEETAFKFATVVTVNEDFADFALFIPADSVLFTDPDVDGSSMSVMARSVNGLLALEFGQLNGYYMIAVSAVPDAYGNDAVQLFAVDGKDTVGISIPISIAPVADPPKAVDDAFTVVQDSVNAISAAKGLLANDVNPDGKSVLKAYLLADATYGQVKVDTTGAFTYAATDYEGEDSFTYFVVNAEGDTSEAATVTLTVVYRNKAPAIIAGVADTVGNRTAALKEDFGTTITFKGSEVTKWFEDPEGDAITYTLSNPDSMVTATINSSYAISVHKVQNACGETFLGVVATDAKGASTTLKIPFVIQCVNDVPARIGGASDTILEPPAGWREAIYVFDLFSDVDDTVLTMTVSNVDKVLNAVVEGDSLIVSLANETQYLQNKVPYTMQVKAKDEAGGSSVAKTLVFMVGDKTAIPQMAAAPKASWQNAILANQGVAAMCDMQGRVMWKAKLPLSEDAVRNAAAKVQGRKILMVNKQTWTIK